MISAQKAKQIPIPAGQGWALLRHLANSRTPITVTFLMTLTDLEESTARAMLLEASSENMGWFRRMDQGDRQMFQGRL